MEDTPTNVVFKLEIDEQSLKKIEKSILQSMEKSFAASAKKASQQASQTLQRQRGGVGASAVAAGAGIGSAAGRLLSDVISPSKKMSSSDVSKSIKAVSSRLRETHKNIIKRAVYEASEAIEAVRMSSAKALKDVSEQFKTAVKNFTRFKTPEERVESLKKLDAAAIRYFSAQKSCYEAEKEIIADRDKQIARQKDALRRLKLFKNAGKQSFSFSTKASSIVGDASRQLSMAQLTVLENNTRRMKFKGFDVDTPEERAAKNFVRKKRKELGQALSDNIHKLTRWQFDRAKRYLEETGGVQPELEALDRPGLMRSFYLAGKTFATKWTVAAYKTVRGTLKALGTAVELGLKAATVSGAMVAGIGKVASIGYAGMVGKAKLKAIIKNQYSQASDDIAKGYATLIYSQMEELSGATQSTFEQLKEQAAAMLGAGVRPMMIKSYTKMLESIAVSTGKDVSTIWQGLTTIASQGKGRIRGTTIDLDVSKIADTSQRFDAMFQALAKMYDMDLFQELDIDVIGNMVQRSGMIFRRMAEVFARYADPFLQSVLEKMDAMMSDPKAFAARMQQIGVAISTLITIVGSFADSIMAVYEWAQRLTQQDTTGTKRFRKAWQDVFADSAGGVSKYMREASEKVVPTTQRRMPNLTNPRSSDIEREDTPVQATGTPRYTMNSQGAVYRTIAQNTPQIHTQAQHGFNPETGMTTDMWIQVALGNRTPGVALPRSMRR